MATRAIEFVCTANFGRSPVAARIAQNYLMEKGENGLYTATSSGGLVNARKLLYCSIIDNVSL